MLSLGFLLPNAGYQDALMHDYKGRLSEATGANLFLLINGELHTPTTETILNGITRQTVMELARKRGIKVVEREIYPDELAKATEVFLTGTAVEVQPVSVIDQRQNTPSALYRSSFQTDYAASCGLVAMRSAVTISLVPEAR
jgi:branched-chain amino acid aminotransferase